MTITPEQFKKWRVDAEKALPDSDWVFEICDREFDLTEATVRGLTMVSEGCIGDACFCFEVDAKHVVNARPQNFIALIDEVERLRAEAKDCHYYRLKCQELEAKLNALLQE